MALLGNDSNVTNETEANFTDFSCLARENLSRSGITNETFWSIREDLLYGTPYVATVVLIFLLLSLGWNLFIIISYLVKYQLLNEAGNIFLLNLAVADLLVAVTVMMFSVVTEIAQNFVFGHTDVIRCTLCGFDGIFFMLLIAVSIHTLAALSIDRFIHLTNAFRYNKLMNKWKAVIIVVIIWIISFLIAVPPAFGFGQHEFNRNFGACVPRFTGDGALGLRNHYYVAVVVLEALIPIFVLAFTNVWTYRFIRKFLTTNFHRVSTYRRREHMSRDNQRHHRQQGQLVKVFSALFIASIISWTPVILVVFLVTFIPAESLPNELYIFGWICYLFNSISHPIIESFFVKDLRYQVGRARRTLRKASSSFISSKMFSSQDLEEAIKEIEKNPNGPSGTRKIKFFRPRNSETGLELVANCVSMGTNVMDVDANSTCTQVQRAASDSDRNCSHENSTHMGQVHPLKKLKKRITFVDIPEPDLNTITELQTQEMVEVEPTLCDSDGTPIEEAHKYIELDDRSSIEAKPEVTAVDIEPQVGCKSNTVAMAELQISGALGGNLLPTGDPSPAHKRIELDHHSSSSETELEVTAVDTESQGDCKSSEPNHR